MEKPRRKRRSLAGLTDALERATTRGGQARAHYELGLFHDNNGREAQAIPHYRKALELGIDAGVVPEALAWLASSLFKASYLTEAALRAGQALWLTTDPSLEGFLRRLLRRIDRAVGDSRLRSAGIEQRSMPPGIPNPSRTRECLHASKRTCSSQECT
ncbi:MAG: tetratricopeptide repeat protein [Chloroflexota bacterium]|nr:tetratricopeptide repeat protein [Chloroflexota bacterium]